MPRSSSWQRLFIALPLLVLSLLLTSACSGDVSVVPTPTPTRPASEPMFLSTQLAVVVPVPAHAGDSVTVICKLVPSYQPNNPVQSYDITDELYGPFPTLAALRAALASRNSTVGPPMRQISLPGGGGASNGGDFGVSQNIFSLPQSLAPGVYDLVVTATLHGGRATARTDTVVQIAAHG